MQSTQEICETFMLTNGTLAWESEGQIFIHSDKPLARYAQDAANMKMTLTVAYLATDAEIAAAYHDEPVHGKVFGGRACCGHVYIALPAL